LPHHIIRESENICMSGKNYARGPQFFPSSTGGASRFFYCAKASRSERNAGLEGYLFYKLENKSCEENTVAVQLLKKVISESTIKWLIGGSGTSIMALCQKDLLSTILTRTSKIIESKILALLLTSGTKDTTVVAKKLTENGGSLVESVESLKKWMLTITNGKTELARGANLVASETLLRISAKENWQQFNNFHPTVKSLSLLQYLCRLLKPPEGGLLLDPFCGSGTTLMAAVSEGWDYIGIEKEAEYVEIAGKRVEWIKEHLEQQDEIEAQERKIERKEP